MRIRSVLAQVGLIVSMIAVGGSAHADDDAPLAAKFSGGKLLKKGTVASLRAHKVSIGGRRAVAVGEIADDLFGEQRQLAAELASAEDALLEPAVTIEEVTETDQATIVTSSTTIVVVDPERLRKKSKRFAKIRNKHRRDDFDLKSLKGPQKKAFEEFRDSLKKKPKKHPLRRAAEQGDEELLDALLEGQGDLTVSTTAVIPKQPPIRTATGTVKFRRTDQNGEIDLDKTVETPSIFGAGGLRGEGPGGGAEIEITRPPQTIEKGRQAHTAKFLTGFTEADDFIWEIRWDFSFGFVSAKLHPWYEFGLRVPVEFNGVLEPATIIEKGPTDKESEFRIDLSAKPVNGNESFYAETGIARDLIKDGKEFLLGAGFEIILAVKIKWLVDKRWVLPENARFDWGAQINPPYDTCDKDCGFDLWIPADTTRTVLRLVGGAVTGSAQLGFKLGGTAKISADFEALFGPDTVPSWNPGKKAEAKRKHHVEFGKPTQERTFIANTGLIEHAGKSKDFGYRISNPAYHWTVTVTPGVKGDIKIKAKPLINDTLEIGPFWLKTFEITLGEVTLDHHKGTKEAYKVKLGEKIWRQRE